MNYFCNAKDFGKTLEKTVSDIQKGCRLAAYKTLEAVAERSRRAVIANYFKKFPDETESRKIRACRNRSQSLKSTKKNSKLVFSRKTIFLL
jgi:hypothetical protein